MAVHGRIPGHFHYETLCLPPRPQTRDGRDRILAALAPTAVGRPGAAQPARDIPGGYSGVQRVPTAAAPGRPDRQHRPMVGELIYQVPRYRDSARLRPDL